MNLGVTCMKMKVSIFLLTIHQTEGICVQLKQQRYKTEPWGTLSKNYQLLGKVKPTFFDLVITCLVGTYKILCYNAVNINA